MNVRAQAALTLSPVLLQKTSLDAAIADNIDKVVAGERSLYKALCYGICRHFFSLSDVYKPLVSKPLKNKDTDVKALILLGIYQVIYLRIPDHAAINETVNGAKRLKKRWAVNLVNGVLRNVVRSREDIRQSLERSATTHYDHPRWLLNRIKKAWPDNWQHVLENNNVQAPMTLRVNRRRFARDAYCLQLQKQGSDYSLSQHSADGVTLTEPSDVDSLHEFNEGACSVQDEAAQIAASLLDLAGAKRVLDACCAPGGKTGHIAETVGNNAQVFGLDADEKRLQRVADNLQRLQLNATLINAQAQDVNDWWDGQTFDRILLDVPCSATGVIRRHPDIKLLRRETDIKDLTTLQLHILEHLWRCLTPGGVLVYATCSVLPDENEKIIAKFVENQADAIHLAIDASWGVERPFGRQLFPQKNGHDGFYYARLRKG